RAGAEVLHMHGEILKGFCTACNARRFLVRGDLSISDVCGSCGIVGTLRPDVVWFGEMPYHMEEIYQRLAEAELFVSIGTSGAVYPAAGFVREAKMLGLQTMELNLEPSDNAYAFDQADYGLAGVVVPRRTMQFGI
ncbi:MAG: Sir2 family NAD-dependent protein deacetylase, partial [Pseudomonadota bacterium]